MKLFVFLNEKHFHKARILTIFKFVIFGRPLQFLCLYICNFGYIRNSNSATIYVRYRENCILKILFSDWLPVGHNC